jgi:hypothetical protein
MERNINAAVKLYSGDKPVDLPGTFRPKSNKRLTMNNYLLIQNLQNFEDYLNGIRRGQFNNF